MVTVQHLLIILIYNLNNKAILITNAVRWYIDVLLTAPFSVMQCFINSVIRSSLSRVQTSWHQVDEIS